MDDNKSQSFPTRLVLENWQFMRLMEWLDQFVDRAPNQGEGSLAYRFHQRFEDDWVNLSARLVDAAPRSLERYAWLTFEQKTIMDPLSISEIRLLIRLVKRILNDLDRKLATTNNTGDAIDLGYEQYEFTRLLQFLESLVEKHLP